MSTHYNIQPNIVIISTDGCYSKKSIVINRKTIIDADYITVTSSPNQEKSSVTLSKDGKYTRIADLPLSYDRTLRMLNDTLYIP